MPFLVPEQLPQHKPVIIAVRSTAPKTGTTTVVWKFALDYAQSEKKVLVFDTLLGLQNTLIKNKNEQLIESVLMGQAPLSQLIDTIQNVDFISGQSTINLYTLNEQEQNHIRTQLLRIIQNYDYILLDTPSQCPNTFLPADETFWVCLPTEKQLFDTVQQAELPIKIILNKVQPETNIARLNLYLKQLSESAQLYKQISAS